MKNASCRFIATLSVAALCGSPLSAKDKHAKTPADQIVIDAHLPLSGGPITRFVATRHYDHLYVYAEREAGRPITVLDLTKPTQPQIVPEVNDASVNLVTVAGTAALSSDTPSTTATATPQTIRLLDLSDPAHPKVTKEFVGVTAMQNVGSGLILLANTDGIWVLSQKFAEDPAVEERYAEKIIYGER